MEKYMINTVKNAMRLLHLFTNETPEWSLTELANKHKLNISSTKRLLNALTEYGYLKKNPKTKRYQLDLSIVRLSGVLTSTMEIYKEARPILLKLADKYEVDCHIGVLEGITVVYLDKFDSPFTPNLTATSHIGKQNPSYCTGCGKVLLAYKSNLIQKDLLLKIDEQGLKEFASKTVKSIDALKKDLDQIVVNGYALSEDELLDGITSVAVPIFDFSENIIAAISLTGLGSKISVEACLDDLIKASHVISSKLGYVKTI